MVKMVDGTLNMNTKNICSNTMATNSPRYEHWLSHFPSVMSCSNEALVFVLWTAPTQEQLAK